MGTPALRGLLERAGSNPARRGWPLVAALLPKSAFEVHPIPSGMRVTAVFLDQPLGRYAELIRIALPDRLPGIVVEPMGIEPTVLRRVRERLALGNGLSRAETVGLMCETYRDFVHHHGPTFGRLLARLAERHTPLVFHCTAGKDRTGMGAALLLSALGVSRDDIMADYLLTNRLYRRDARVEEAAPPEVLDVLWQVQPDFLHAALRAIDTDFGGMAAYLAGPVGLDAPTLQRLREQLLDPT